MYNKEHNNNNYYELLPQSWYNIIQKRMLGCIQLYTYNYYNMSVNMCVYYM